MLLYHKVKSRFFKTKKKKFKVIKPSVLHDMGHGCDRLSLEARVDLIYYYFNIKIKNNHDLKKKQIIFFTDYLSYFEFFKLIEIY